jgi:hypothetical protein
VPGPSVIFRAWDGVERKNALRATDLQKVRHARARAARDALIPLVAAEVAGKCERANREGIAVRS